MIIIEYIDWEMLRQQKEFCLNHGGDDAMRLAHFLDNLQDNAVKQGHNKLDVFGE